MKTNHSPNLIKFNEIDFKKTKLRLIFPGTNGQAAIYPLAVVFTYCFEGQNCYDIVHQNGAPLWAGPFIDLRDNFGASLETTDPAFVRHVLHFLPGEPGIVGMSEK